MSKIHIVFLRHILECIETIEQYSKNLSEKKFLKSSEKQDAIIRRLEIIGEAVGNLPDEYKNKHPDVEWGRAMGTRNILIHHYLGVDLEIVWNTVSKSLPQFKKQIKSLLETR